MVASSIWDVDGVDRSAFVMGANIDFFSAGDTGVVVVRFSRDRDAAVFRAKGAARG